MFRLQQSRFWWVVVAGVLAAVGAGAGGGEKAAEKSEKGGKEEKAKEAKGDPVARAYQAFIKEPTKENYLKAFQAVTTAKTYSPYAMDLEEIGELVVGKKYKEAQGRLEKAMPGLLLSPRAHIFAAEVAEALGDKAAVERENDATRKCIKGILGTGDGTGDKPYLVTRVSDEYDVLMHLKKGRGPQALKMKDGKSFDVIFCKDGSEVWFDVTVMFGALKAEFDKKK